MAGHLHRSVEITIGLPRADAIELFTAEGERRWAKGWEPHYPEPTRREGAGAVFTTAHGGHQTTWIMIEHAPERISYARVTHGMTAGTVCVEVIRSDEAATHVRVTYDLTALSAAGEQWLDSFEQDYVSEIESWAADIAASVEPSD